MANWWLRTDGKIDLETRFPMQIFPSTHPAINLAIGCAYWQSRDSLSWLLDVIWCYLCQLVQQIRHSPLRKEDTKWVYLMPPAECKRKAEDEQTGRSHLKGQCQCHSAGWHWVGQASSCHPVQVCHSWLFYSPRSWSSQIPKILLAAQLSFWTLGVPETPNPKWPWKPKP